MVSAMRKPDDASESSFQPSPDNSGTTSPSFMLSDDDLSLNLLADMENPPKTEPGPVIADLQSVTSKSQQEISPAEAVDLVMPDMQETAGIQLPSTSDPSSEPMAPSHETGNVVDINRSKKREGAPISARISDRLVPQGPENIQATASGLSDLYIPPNEPSRSNEAISATAMGLSDSPSAHPQRSQVEAAAREQQLKAKRIQELLDINFWHSAQSRLLRPVENGGLRTHIDSYQHSVAFSVAKAGLGGFLPGKLELNLATNRIQANFRKISAEEVAKAMIECGKAAGWTTMSFEGSREFIQIAHQLASKEGINVVTPDELRLMAKQKQTMAHNTVQQQQVASPTPSSASNDRSLVEDRDLPSPFSR